MRKRNLVFVCAMVVIVAVVTSLVAAQAQRGRARGGGTLRMGCNIEGLWAQLTFEAKLSEAKLMKMRPIFQKAWDERAQLATEFPDRADTPAMFEKLEEKGLYADLLDHVDQQTTDQEFGKLASWIQEQNEILEMIRERFGMAGGM